MPECALAHRVRREARKAQTVNINDLYFLQVILGWDAALRGGTGLRLGELAGVGDVQFEVGFIDVRRNRTGGELTTPKNGNTRGGEMSKMPEEELKSLGAAEGGQAEGLEGAAG